MQRTLVVIPARMQATPAAGQAAGRHRRRADDRARVAPRHGGRGRPGGGRHRHARRSWPPCARPAARPSDAHRPRLRLRPRVRGRQPASTPTATSRSSSTCRAICRRWSLRLVRDCLGAAAGQGARISPPSPPRSRTPTIAPTRTWSRWWARRPECRARLRALYFTRATAPSRRGPALPSRRHVRLSPLGAGAVRVAPPSTLEKREQLEQLRALEDGMRIDVTLVDSVPLGSILPHDLERARRIICRQGAALNSSHRAPPTPRSMADRKLKSPAASAKSEARARAASARRCCASPTRASRAPTRTWPAARCFPIWSRWPAPPSRTRWRR